MIDFAYALKDNYQVVYSDETLKEIKRSGEYADKFLDVLSKLEAFHIKQRVTASFELTGEVTISKRDTYVAYNEYCEQEPIYEELLHSMMQSLFKTHGGRKGDEFEILKNEQLGTFSNLMGHLNEQAEIIKEVSPILADSINDLITLSMKQMEATLEESTALMSSSIDDEKYWSGVKAFRDAMNIGPKELNNISPPNVLEKIWELYKVKDEYKDLNWTVEDFFSLKQNPVFPNKPYFGFQKVTSIYNHLNLIGYHPDSKTHRERRFTAAMSDQGHASVASFANVLFSRDESFVKKTKAAYEFLGINTEVMLVTL